ncbi:MAG: ribonucleotide-diphosphate reductase subunit beta [Thermoleophilaceae bacterium]
MSAVQSTPVSVPAERLSYRDLYERWEQSHWSASTIDLGADRAEWDALDERERRILLWHLGSFVHGESAVADQLGSFIDAAPRDEQRHFLATQQADEARHAVFFCRFIEEVCGVRDPIADTHGSLPYGFRKTFGCLERMHSKLRDDPSPERLAAGIALYHLVIEATMAQNALHFLERHLDQSGRFPGLLEGVGHILSDEQRHIGFGVRMLYDLSNEHPGARDAVADELRGVLRYSLGVGVPPGWDLSYPEALGYTLEELYESSTVALKRALRSAGLADLPGPPPIPRGIEPAAQARIALLLLRAGVLGEGPVTAEPGDDVLAALFDLIARTTDVTRSKGEVIQWSFDDADPWHLDITPARATPHRGRAPRASLTFRCAFADWADVVARRLSIERALLTRRVRLRGSPRVLLRLPKLLTT